MLAGFVPVVDINGDAGKGQPDFWRVGILFDQPQILAICGRNISLLQPNISQLFSGILMETIMFKDIQKFDCSTVQITGGQQRQAGLIKRISFFFVCFARNKTYKNKNDIYAFNYLIFIL